MSLNCLLNDMINYQLNIFKKLIKSVPNPAILFIVGIFSMLAAIVPYIFGFILVVLIGGYIYLRQRNSTSLGRATDNTRRDFNEKEVKPEPQEQEPAVEEVKPEPQEQEPAVEEVKDLKIDEDEKNKN